MNGRKSKQLRKTMLNKTPEVLVLIRSEVGEKTKEMHPTAIWRTFKRLYKQGKVSEDLLVTK